jgi:polyadenylation factor subunit 2
MSGISRRNVDLDIPFDQRMQQQTHRTTIDYFTPVGKYMISKNVYNKKRRRVFPRGYLRPDKSYITDLTPSLISNPPIVDLCSKFIHSSTNKSKHAIHAIKWTPDARRILVSSYSGEFTLWNGLTFSFESIMQAHDLPIFSLEYSHNGKWLLSGDQSGCIKFWQPNFNNVNILPKAHENTVGGIVFSPNDSKFVSCSDDQTLKIWDFTTSREERTLKGHHWDVKSCDWHSSLGLIVSGSKDNLVKLWDPRDSTCITTIHDFKHTVSATSFQKNGNERLLAACSRDHSTRVFDLRMLRAIHILKSEKESDLTSLAWHPVHSTMLSVGGYDGSLAHYDLNKTADIETFNNKSQQSKEEELEMLQKINELKENSNDDKLKDEISEYMFANFANRGAPITFKALHSIPFAHDKAIYSIEYHPLGHMLCTAGADKSMRIWSRARPDDVAGFKDHAHTGEDTVFEKTTIVNENDENKVDGNLVESNQTLPGFSIPGFT